MFISINCIQGKFAPFCFLTRNSFDFLLHYIGLLHKALNLNKTTKIGYKITVISPIPNEWIKRPDIGWILSYNSLIPDSNPEDYYILSKEDIKSHSTIENLFLKNNYKLLSQINDIPIGHIFLLLFFLITSFVSLSEFPF